MRVGYSILQEIKNGSDGLVAAHYGLTEVQFERMITLLQRQGYIDRVLRAGDERSLKPAKLTPKGEDLLMVHADWQGEYPSTREGLKAWVQVEKDQYDNGAEEW